MQQTRYKGGLFGGREGSAGLEKGQSHAGREVGTEKEGKDRQKMGVGVDQAGTCGNRERGRERAIWGGHGEQSFYMFVTHTWWSQLVASMARSLGGP